LGLPDQLLPTTIRPLDPAKVLAGIVFTVSGHLDPTLDPHATLLAWTGFPVWCRYFTPRDVVGRWVADTTGEPIEIGGVAIKSGDYVLADRDGVVIIPGGLAADVTEKVEQVLSTENKVRTAILQGVDPVEAYLQFGKF
jgi:regulator of RNase E activity RraA